MRSSLPVLALLAVFALPAAAQTANPPAQMFMSKQQIMALIEKAKADRQGDAPMVPEPILLMPPYRAQLEYRPAVAPAASHDKDAELFVILQGTGTIVTGGKLVDEKRVNANNSSGSSIAGGTSQAVAPGDTLIVPATVPHQVIPGGGEPIVVMTMHVPQPTTNWPPPN